VHNSLTVVLRTVQLQSYIIALPEINVAVVQMPRVPNIRGHMTVNVKQPDQHYTYIDMTKFRWDCKSNMWRRCRTGGDRSVTVDCDYYELDDFCHYIPSKHRRHVIISA